MPDSKTAEVGRLCACAEQSPCSCMSEYIGSCHCTPCPPKPCPPKQATETSSTSLWGCRSPEARRVVVHDARLPPVAAAAVGGSPVVVHDAGRAGGRRRGGRRRIGGRRCLCGRGRRRACAHLAQLSPLSTRCCMLTAPTQPRLFGALYTHYCRSCNTDRSPSRP